MSIYPKVKYTRRLRQREAHLAITSSLYLLTEPPASFATFRNAFRFPLSRSATTLSHPHSSNPLAIRLTTETKSLTLHCATATDAEKIISALRASTAPLSTLQASILSYRRHADPALQAVLGSLSTQNPPRSTLLSSLQTLVETTRGAPIPPTECAQALLSPLQTVNTAVKTVEHVLGSVEIVAPIIAIASLAADVAVLCARRADSDANMRALVPRVNAIVGDVVTALLFSLDAAVTESSLVSRLFIALERALDAADLAERFVMRRKVSQIMSLGEVETLGAVVQEVEEGVTALRILQYVQENHVRNVRLDECRQDVFRRAYVTVPVMLVLECAVQAQIKKRLCGEPCASGIVVLFGMFGTGKSTLISVVSNDAGVRQYFDGGVYCMKVASSEVIASLADVVRQSGGLALAVRVEQCNELEKAVALVKAWFFGRRCLFVWDDVDGLVLSELRSLPDVSVGGRALVATWDQRVFRGVVHESDVVTTGLLKREETQTMLCKCAGFEEEAWRVLKNKVPDGRDVAVVEKLAEACDGLPTTISAAGRAVAALGGDVFEAFRTAMKNGGLERMFAEGYSAQKLFGRPELQSHEFYGNLAKRIDDWDVSAEDFRGMFVALSVLRPGFWTGVEVLQRVWGRGEQCLRDILAVFSEVNLLMVRHDKGSLQVRVQKLVHWYCKEQAVKDGLYTTLHDKLLSSYDPNLDRSWWEHEFTQMEYLRGSLTYHLLQAGRVNELKSLLLDFRWVDTGLRIRKDTVNMLLSDYEVVMRGDHPKEAELGDLLQAVSFIHDGLLLSRARLQSYPSECAFQLEGRLQHCDMPLIQNFLTSVQQHSSKPSLSCLTNSLEAAGGPLIQSIPATHSLSSMAVIPGTSTVFVAGRDGVSLINIENGVTHQLANRRRGEAKSVAVTRDGKYAVVMWEHGGVYVCSLNGSGVDDHSLDIGPRHGENHPVCLAVTPDSQQIVTGGYGGNVCVWQLESGKPVAPVFEGHTSAVTSVAVSGNGRFVASTAKNSVRIWDLQCQENARVIYFEDSFYGLKFVEWTVDDSAVFVGDENRNVVMCPVVEGHSHQTGRKSFSGHTSYVVCAAVSSDGRYVASGSLDTTVRIWDLGTGNMIGEPYCGHVDTVTAVLYNERMKCVLSASKDGTLKQWRVEPGTVRSSVHSKKVCCLVPFSSKGMIASGSTDRSVVLWNSGTGKKMLGPLLGDKRPVRSISFAFDGNTLACGHDSGNVWIWDTRDGRVVHKELKCHRLKVECTAFSRDGRFLATGGQDQCASIWDIGKGKAVLQKISGHRNWVTCVGFSEDGAVLACGSFGNSGMEWNKGCIYFWDTSTGKAAKESITVRGRPKAVKFCEQDTVIEVTFQSSTECRRYLVKNGQEIDNIGERTVDHSQRAEGRLHVRNGGQDVRNASDGALLGHFECDVTTEPVVVESERCLTWVGLQNGIVACLVGNE